MSITLDDVRKVARLAQLELAPSEEAQTLTHLNNIFALVDQMATIDTTGVEPLNHPIGLIHDMAQRLRPDAVTEVDNRRANMANAPEQDADLFLVPKVID